MIQLKQQNIGKRGKKMRLKRILSTVLTLSLLATSTAYAWGFEIVNPHRENQSTLYMAQNRPINQEFVGLWTVDADRTMKENNGVSLRDVYGSSIKYGSTLKISTNGEISYSIAVAEKKNGKITAENTDKLTISYSTPQQTTKTISILKESDSQTYLVSIEDDYINGSYKLYWKKVLVGTWKTTPNQSEYATAYTTVFCPDGRIVQYGYRNRDVGTYKIVNDDTVIATFTHNMYDYPGIGYQEIENYTYTVTYKYHYTSNATIEADYSKDFEQNTNSNANDGILYWYSSNIEIPTWADYYLNVDSNKVNKFNNLLTKLSAQTNNSLFYAFFDFDQDGQEELIVNEDGADISDVYTIQSGKPINIGKIDFTAIYYVKDEKLYAINVNMDYLPDEWVFDVTVKHVTIEAGKIVTFILYQIEDNHMPIPERNEDWENQIPEIAEFKKGAIRLAFSEFQGNMNLQSFESGTPSDWAIQEVLEARELGLIPESLDGKYQDNITRQEFCELAANLIEVSTGASISEVLDNLSLTGTYFQDTSNEAISAMNALHIVTGSGENTFSPNNTITREEAATMLTRLAKVLNEELSKNSTMSFSDVNNLDDWAYYSILFLSNMKNPAGQSIMGSTGDNAFSPKDTFSREQAIIAFKRLMQVTGKCNTNNLRIEDSISPEDVSCISAFGYITNNFGITTDGSQIWWIPTDNEIGLNYSDKLISYTKQKPLGEDDFEMWVRPYQNTKIPIILDKDGVITATDFGMARIIVQSPVSGTIWKTLTVVSADIKSQYLLGTRISSYPINGLPANFYTSGMFVDNYKIAYGKDVAYVTMDVYNRTAIYGSIDIYDKDGKYLRSERINRKKTMPTSIKDVVFDACGLFSDATSKELLTYRQNSYTQKTSISIEVPEGGYLVISNNSEESIGAAVFNFSDFMLNAVLKLSEVVLKDAETEKAAESFSAAILGELKKISADQTDIAKDLAIWAQENYTIENQSDFVNQYVNHGITLFKKLDIDAVNILMSCISDVAADQITGILERAFEKASGPAGIALRMAFDLTDWGNLLVQIDHLQQSHKAKTIHIIYPSEFELY